MFAPIALILTKLATIYMKATELHSPVPGAVHYEVQGDFFNYAVGEILN